MSAGFWGQYVLVLAIVGLMLLGLYAIVRGLTRGRILSAGGKRLVGVVDSIALSQNTTLHVVKAGSKYLILGGGSGHVSTLGEIPSEDVEAWIAEQRRAHDAQVATVSGFMSRLRGKKT